jgi:hypothetical protein
MTQECASTDEQSVVLLRQGESLVLLVSSLRTTRRDFNRRPIRNAVAWVGTSADEPSLRVIAAAKLREWWRDRERDPLSQLECEIDRAIRGIESIEAKDIGEGERAAGFGADRSQLERLARAVELARKEASPDEGVCHIQPNTNEHRTALAELLEKHWLPDRQGPLVIVGRFVRGSLLEEKTPWYGLSELIQNEYKVCPSERAEKKKRLLAWAIPVLALFAIISVVLWRIQPVWPSKVLVCWENGFATISAAPANGERVPHCTKGLTLKVAFNQKMNRNRLATTESSLKEIVCEQAAWDEDGHTCSIPLRIADADPNAPLSCKIIVSGMADSWGRSSRPLDVAFDVERSDLACQAFPNDRLTEGKVTIRGSASGRYGIHSVTVNATQASLHPHQGNRSVEWEASLLLSFGKQTLFITIEDDYGNRLRSEHVISVAPNPVKK